MQPVFTELHRNAAVSVRNVAGRNQKLRQHIGGKAVFYIPGNLAYGSKPPQGSMIAPNSTLIYEVEVLEIKPCD